MKVIDIFSLVIILFCNAWTWEILHFNLYLLVLILITSLFLYLSITRLSRKLSVLFYLFLIPILVIQWKTTDSIFFGHTNIDDRNISAIRRNELPKFTFSIFNKYIVLNSGRYLENEWTLIFYKFEQNFFRSIDLNLYFFGNHPRERPGIREFEKFPFFFIPFFVIGLLKMLRSRNWQFIISFLPILELSIVGQNNFLGPFSLFPFFSVSMALGLFYVMEKALIKVKR